MASFSPPSEMCPGAPLKTNRARLTEERLPIAAALAGGVPYIALFRALDLPDHFLGFALLGAAYGLLVGRWWAVFFSAGLIALTILDVPAPHEEDYFAFKVVFGVLLPTAIACTAAGVGLRKLAGRLVRAL